MLELELFVEGSKDTNPSISTKPFSLNVGVPARQVGWVSKRGDIIDFPLSGNGEHICKKDNAVYKLINNNLVVNKL